VLTVRDDFLIRAAQLPALRGVLAARLQLVTTPAAADLRRILVEPARRAGYAFEDDALATEMVERGRDQPARWRCCRSPRRACGSCATARPTA
jgi:hypothetical protein